MVVESTPFYVNFIQRNDDLYYKNKCVNEITSQFGKKSYGAFYCRLR